MALNRELQRKLLERLAESYPAHQQGLEGQMEGYTHQEARTNIAYLKEHGLVKAADVRISQFHTTSTTITAKGLDFLADDGGLTAILGTVTIKLHEDTLRQMLEHRIASLDAPAETKQSLLADLRSLPSEAIKHLTLSLLDKGMAALPNALPLLQGLLQSWKP